MYVLLFDIDGTLLSSGGAGQAAMEAAISQEFGITAPVEGIPTAGRTDFAITRDLLAFHGLPTDGPAVDRLMHAYLDLLPGHLASLQGQMLPGVAQLLPLLAEREDVLLGLLTGNFQRGATAKLEYFGIDHHFRCGGFGDWHPHRDDVAREALRAVETHIDGQVNPERLWVIGDTPADVQCGRAIAANVLAVATGIYEASVLADAAPDHLFDDLSDLTRVLALWE